MRSVTKGIMRGELKRGLYHEKIYRIDIFLLQKFAKLFFRYKFSIILIMSIYILDIKLIRIR